MKALTRNMNQSYTLTNMRTGQVKYVGKMCNDMIVYIEQFEWQKTDYIVGRGDYGDVFYYNDPSEPPEVYKQYVEREHWDVLRFAAKKMGIPVKDLADQYIRETF